MSFSRQVFNTSVLETRRAAGDFPLKLIYKKDSHLFSTETFALLLFLSGLSAGLECGASVLHPILPLCSRLGRFWVGVMPSRAAFCSLTDPCAGWAGCRRKLSWWEREIRCVDRAELLMPSSSRGFRSCFLRAPSSPSSPLKRRAPDPRFFMDLAVLPQWPPGLGLWGLAAGFWWLLAPPSHAARGVTSSSFVT